MYLILSDKGIPICRMKKKTFTFTECDESICKERKTKTKTKQLKFFMKHPKPVSTKNSIRMIKLPQDKKDTNLQWFSKDRMTGYSEVTNAVSAMAWMASWNQTHCFKECCTISIIIFSKLLVTKVNTVYIGHRLAAINETLSHKPVLSGSCQPQGTEIATGDWSGFFFLSFFFFFVVVGRITFLIP